MQLSNHLGWTWNDEHICLKYVLVCAWTQFLVKKLDEEFAARSTRLQTKSLDSLHQVYRWLASSTCLMVPPHPIVKCIAMALGVIRCEVELLVDTSTPIANVVLHTQMRRDKGKFFNQNLSNISWKMNLNSSNAHIAKMVEATSYDANEWVNNCQNDFQKFADTTPRLQCLYDREFMCPKNCIKVEN